MLNTEWIEKTEDFLKSCFDSSAHLNAHPEDKAYRIEHSYRVANIGRQIAASEGFDETEMTIACLLHDISYCEEFGENGWKEHGRRSAQIARPFLKGLGIPDARIEDISYGIAIHVDDDADFEGERTPFALTVGDADNIDRFDAYRIYEGLRYNDFDKMNYAEKCSYVEKRLLRLKELRELPNGTKTADALWKSRIDFYIVYFEKLADQLRNSKSII